MKKTCQIDIRDRNIQMCPLNQASQTQLRNDHTDMHHHMISFQCCWCVWFRELVEAFGIWEHMWLCRRYKIWVRHISLWNHGTFHKSVHASLATDLWPTDIHHTPSVILPHQQITTCIRAHTPVDKSGHVYIPTRLNLGKETYAWLMKVMAPLVQWGCSPTCRWDQPR
jgi:hypothetical protein